jgi:hypothetical protein
MRGGVGGFSPDNVGEAFSSSSKAAARMRAQRRAGQPVKNEFTEEEHEEMT